MSDKRIGTRGRWEKYNKNPVLGGELGTCFDVSVLRVDSRYVMYFSWRPKGSIAVTESVDGFVWSKPKICLEPRATPEGWQDDLNRPSVVFRDGLYHMWVTGQFKPGQADGTSHIFYATSKDGLNFERAGELPVLVPELPWEKQAVMNPHVFWDGEEQLYKMWYSGGEQYEPNAIGHATSEDGICWTKHKNNPVFSASPTNRWENHKVAGCHVVKVENWYIMFYIGYFDEDYAQIGMARSLDGVTNWERYPMNPIIAPSPGGFDGEACYKPYPLYDGEKWLLWYNGRIGDSEQIGVAIRQGLDLWA